MASVVTTSKLSLKIVYDKKNKKVVFAEAEKEAVDFLIYMLSLPLATVTTLLSKSEMGMVGCLNNLHQSVSNLDQSYFLEGEDIKDLLLKPMLSFSAQAPLLTPYIANRAIDTIYKCSNHNVYGTNLTRRCPNFCTFKSNYKVVQIAARDGKGSGFVNGLVKYIVMDNLLVKPITSISSICLLKEYMIDVKDLVNVDEIVVDLGFDEGLQILKASLEGELVITSVFLDKLA